MVVVVVVVVVVSPEHTMSCMSCFQGLFFRRQNARQARLDKLDQLLEESHQMLEHIQQKTSDLHQTLKDIQEKTSNLEFRQHLAQCDAPGAARILEAYATGQMWGMRPGPVSQHVHASLLQTGHFSKGILKASCDIRRGQYHQLQQVLARRGHQWALQYQDQQGKVDENEQGHDALYLPWIQAQLLAGNPSLTPAHFQEYYLTP